MPRLDLFGLEKSHKISSGDEVSHLVTVYDAMMLGIVRGLLEDENIPYLVRERGSGDIVRIVVGVTQFGTDIYVPTEALEAARDLIAGMEDFDGNGVGGTVTFVDENGNEITPEEAAEAASAQTEAQGDDHA